MMINSRPNAVLGKTEEELLAEMNASPRKTTGFSWGMHRGRGGTAKLERFGWRKMNAARRLEARGLAHITNQYNSIEYVRGHGAPYHDVTLALGPKPKKEKEIHDGNLCLPIDG